MEGLMTALVAINVAVYGYLVVRSLHRIEEKLCEIDYSMAYAVFQGVAKHTEHQGHDDGSEHV